MPDLFPTPIASDGSGAKGLDPYGKREPSLADFKFQRLTNWGKYLPAITRWANIHGETPEPQLPSGDLSPEFVEWMMGLPRGHVTDPAIGLTWSGAVTALGNSVVPAQAEDAYTLCLDGWTQVAPTSDQGELRSV
ncbi:hypothetical protein SEA_CAMERICO_39 [Gordonia phage Camerico]|nr:hypothetical protein SEA_CAMERICO_39 [Gordonia phage Camerico]